MVGIERVCVASVRLGRCGPCNRDDNGQSNLESNSGSYSTGNLESNGQSYGESNEDGDSDRNGVSNGQSYRWSNGDCNCPSN